ncbi:hypothetical protein O6H91_10G028900 [Diphasiastrum complanatum]|uniref:Uncharacterized protein n=1 Tax=Diphasiastrum complanatum TaxID=34168 RepID=A0ACC2CFL7_DIPCM|nr:hypothetical protein O6H91_Y306700 [Diphasiastrum complanatum]KAJ7540745.1 hypothetical protein O6H91_10G028900 [Diphasiastrum complanatum]
MVKLASVRRNRQYGPPGSRDLSEVINAFLYVVATLMLLAGSIIQLPGLYVDNRIGLTLILISMVIIIAVNLHDLYAHLAAIGFRLRYLSFDRQMLLVEIAAPLVQSIGAIFFFVGTFYLLKTSGGIYPGGGKRGTRGRLAYWLLVAGPALWLLGSIHNASQVYEKANLQVQAYQGAVGIPFIIGSNLFLVSSILTIQSWPRPALGTVQAITAWFQIAASACWLIAAIMNSIKVIQVQQIERLGGELEPVRGLFEQERALLGEQQQEPFLEERAARRRAETVVPIPTYKEVAVHSELNY